MSLGKKVLESSGLLIGIKFFQRFVGLISILFLARLLTPDDFAIVALTAIVVHFFDMLSNAGSEQYIIQKGHVDTDDLNTAWTIDITMKSILWLILISGSSQIASFFEQPELEMALYASSVILIINAAKNPGLFLKKQNLEYGQIFFLSVIQRLSTFIIVISIAYIERSYWALIIGDIISSLIFTIGSYKIDNHKARLCFSQWQKQWSFSFWLLLKGIIGYTRSQIDTLIVSKFYPSALLGQYYMARDLAMMPSHNLLSPAIEPLLAAFKHSREDKKSLEYQVRFSIFIVALASIPMSMFMWFFPQPIIDTLLGTQWKEATGLLSALSLLLLYFSFILVLEQCLLSLKKVKALFWYDVFSLILITAGMLMLTMVSHSLESLAYARGILGIITMMALFIYIRRILNIKILRILLLIAPIFSISSISIYLSLQFEPIMQYPLAQLMQYLFIFCVSYILFITVFFITIDIDEIKTLKQLILSIKRPHNEK